MARAADEAMQARHVRRRWSISWRVRCWIVLPLAIACGEVGATSPHNAWDFKSNVAMSYLLVLAMSFLFARPKLRAHGRALPQAHAIVRGQRSQPRAKRGLVMSSIQSFEEAAQLDTAVLRQLLDGPRPEQRVWAIWALALRNQDVVGLAKRTAIEHDPGVRRTLAVILASHGETDLLVALARHDPAIVVRASAMQLVTRLAAGGAIDRVVVLEAERREPAIRIAILAAIDATAPDFLVELARRLIADADETVQLEAFEALVRVGSPARIERATDWLRDLGTELVAAGYQRPNRVGYNEVIARTVAPLSLEIRTTALRALHAPDWQMMLSLVDGGFGEMVEAMRRPDVIAPLAALQQAMVMWVGPEAVIAAQVQLARPELPRCDAILRELRAYCRTRSQALFVHLAKLGPLDAVRELRQEHIELEVLAQQIERLAMRYG